MKIWMNGKIVAAEDARVHVTDHGLLYGDGLFEGMRVYGGRVFRIDEHLKRLEIGARILLLELPYSSAEIKRIVEDTVRAFGEREGYIRLVVTRGEGPLGVDPTTCPRATLFCIVTTIKLFSEELRVRGLDLLTSSYRRPTADALDVRVKSLNYLGSVLAKLEAKQRGADDAILLNPRGHVAETSVANVFVLRGQTLSTPPASDGCLEGITRRSVMELARGLGLEVQERSLGRADLYAADEVFMTGSGAGIITARSLDARVLGSGERGPVTAKLTTLHRELAETEGPEIVG